MSAGMYDAVDALAERRGLTRSEYVRHAVTSLVQREFTEVASRDDPDDEMARLHREINAIGFARIRAEADRRERAAGRGRPSA